MGVRSRKAELMRTHERRRGKEYDLVVFYQPDSVVLKPLDAGMIVGDPGVRLFYDVGGDDGCGDHNVMTRAAATGFAGMFSAAEKAFSRESDGCPVPVRTATRGGKEDDQCFKGVYVRQKLGMRRKVVRYRYVPRRGDLPFDFGRSDVSGR